MLPKRYKGGTLSLSLSLRLSLSLTLTVTFTLTITLRAVPEIILGGHIFVQTPPPPGQTWSQSPPTPRTRKCFN